MRTTGGARGSCTCQPSWSTSSKACSGSTTAPSAVVQSDNPGSVASHRIANTFDVKATRPVLPPGWHPDELMIDWGSTPPDSEVQIFLPAADADEILRMAASLYGVTTLKKIDDHTLGCKANGMTWLPLPPGSGANYAGLMTMDLPSTVKKGQSFTVVVKQVTSGIARQVPPPPPVINAKRVHKPVKEEGVKIDQRPEARRIHGAYQLTIPVTTKAHMLPAEERLFSVLRWIEKSIEAGDRWLPVFERYVGTVGDRVKALGGDPGHIRPSPDGSGVHGERAPHTKPGGEGTGRGEHRLHLTGKVDGLVYDRFGDFDGFILDTEDGERHFHCRELEMAEVLYEAWSERVLLTVVVEEDALSRPEKIILRSPPPPHVN